MVQSCIAARWKRCRADGKTSGDQQTDARENKRGLWAEPNPTPPWEWRDRQRRPAKEPLAVVSVVPNGVLIAALLPNPDGRDEGNEQVRIQNGTDRAVDLAGWRLLDRAGNKFQLGGQVAAGSTVTIKLDPPTLPLNNDGDEVLLIDRAGVLRCRVEYTGQQVRAGTWAVGV